MVVEKKGVVITLAGRWMARRMNGSKGDGQRDH